MSDTQRADMSQRRQVKRNLLAATSVTGLASVANITISIIRMKLVVLLVGPAGIGLLGLYLRLTTLAATLSGMGLSQSGVREVAAAKTPAAVAATRRAMLIASAALGALAWGALWLAREPIAAALLDDAARASDVMWLGLAVFATGLATVQTAYLQGLRRIRESALVLVLGGLVGAVIGLSFVWALGSDGLVVLVVASPLGGSVVAWWFSRRARRDAEAGAPLMSWGDLSPRWRALASMGVAVTVSHLATHFVALHVRTRIVEELGLEASGYFEASWQISMTYIGFVLAAMGVEYFPRVTAAIASEKDITLADKPSHRLVHDQIEIALLLAAPVLVGLAGLAPIGIHVLYSDDFGPSIELLRVQALGDTMKIMAWPLSYYLLAHGQNRLYLLGELVWNVIFFAGVQALLPLGLLATSLAYVVAFAGNLAFLTVAARRVDRLKVDRRHWAVASAIAGLVLVLNGLAAMSEIAGIIGGLIAVGGLGYVSLDRLARILDGQGRVGRLLAKIGLGRS